MMWPDGGRDRSQHIFTDALTLFGLVEKPVSLGLDKGGGNRRRRQGLEREHDARPVLGA